MEDYSRARYGGPTDSPFVGQPVTPPRGRITTPLPNLAELPAPPPGYIPPHGYIPAPVQAAPARRTSRPGRAVLTAMLALGLVTGSLGGGATAWLLSQNNPSSAALQQAAPIVINSNGVAQQSSGTIGALYTKVANSVVSITTREGNGGRFAQSGEGSGIVIDKGHILTNYHVVQGASTIRVILADNTSVTAKLVASAVQDDLAVLSADLPADKIQVATLGDSDKVGVGDEVVAIGNPFGLEQTVTAGIISAVHRNWTSGSGPVRQMIQTDAPINPGNSGGPLFNLQGEVIGITTAIESPVRGSVGIGFAIPTNRAKTLLPQLLQGSNVQRVWLGISGSALDADLAAQVKAPVEKGVLVAGVVPDSPAAKAGLVPMSDDGSTLGDIITAVDGNAVGGVEQITAYLENKRVGDTVTVTVLRAGKSQDIKVTLAAWPETTRQDSMPAPFPGMPDPNAPNPPQERAIPSVWLGVRGAALNADLATQLKVAINQGVVLVEVIADSPSAKAGLQAGDLDANKAGDIITAIDGTAVGSIEAMQAQLQGKKAGDAVTLTVWRDGATREVKVTLADRPAGGSGM